LWRGTSWLRRATSTCGKGKSPRRGTFTTRVYTDKDGVKREVTEIVLEELVILDKMPDDVKEKWILRMRQMVLRYRSKSPARKSRKPRMIESFGSRSVMRHNARIKGLRK
jgi:single-stranded DNA-binding protein